MILAALALALAAVPGAPPTLAAETPPLAQEDWDGSAWAEDEDDRRPRLFLAAWGGEALDAGGAGRSSTMLGAEGAWAFSSLEVGLAGYGYRRLADATRDWTPVALLRLTQRFRTRGPVEAGLTFGVGAGRPDGWEAWYQVALGGRVTFGALFLGGEIAFEQYDVLRLAAAVGLAL